MTKKFDFISKVQHYFTESCSAVLSTIFSSGRDGMPQISTIKPNNTCADDFGGTSAVNPFAAGVIGTFFRMLSYSKSKNFLNLNEDRRKEFESNDNLYTNLY